MWHHNPEDGILYSQCPEGETLNSYLTLKCNLTHTHTNKCKQFNPFAYTDVCETAGLARSINPLNPELNPICYSLALLAYHFLHISRIRVKSLTIRLIMSYIYMERLFLMFLDHTQRRTTVGRTPLDE